MNELQELTGVVDKLIFQNQENGYSVFLLKTRGTDAVTVTGHLPAVQPGQQVNIQGFWVMHKKFGKQFEAKSCTSCLPNSILGLKKYLGSGMIKGIGPVYAAKLVKKFGVDVLEIIENQPERLQEIDGIGPKRIEKITVAWKEQKEISKVMIFLQEKGVSTVYATKIYKQYGQEAIAIMNENPYRLADDIWGIGFKKADAVAQQMGFEKNSLKRINSGILFVISQELNNGHLYVQLKDLKQKTIDLLELENNDDISNKIKMALHNLYDSEKIKLISVDDSHFVTLAQYYFSEKGAANKILKLVDRKSPHEFDLQQIYKKLRVESGPHDLLLNEDQQKGVLSCLQHKVTVITGGPGTGKTTLVKKLLAILDEYHIRYKLAAPTGRAAKRMFESTGRHASTIHRLLEFDFNNFSFFYNEQNALPIDFLIVDEASMIDIFLANALLKALPLDAHIIFIGDIYQLPSVGAGNFLKDLIASGKASSVFLKKIFRQAQDSMIVVNAHRVNNGEFPLSHMPDSKRDFIFLKEPEPENVTVHLQTIYKKGLGRFKIHHENAIVLSPMHRGAAGTQKINYDLQNIVNPSQNLKKVSYAGTEYKIGDPVMQLRNNYDKHVFNGDIGKIVDINIEDRALFVNFNDRIVEYDSADLNEIVLAYAISIHKSQGSEYDAAIIPIFTQHFTLLQRNLIYTAITRAKKLCIFIGQPKAIAIAVKNNKSLVRKTFLKEYLTTDLQCR